MENKENLIVLIGYPLLRSGIVNDFLKHNGLDKDLEVVQASVEFKSTSKEGYRNEFCTTCLALKPIDEKTAFIYNIKGSDNIINKLDQYVRDRPHNKGVS
jgi:hypothetical protein